MTEVDAHDCPHPIGQWLCPIIGLSAAPGLDEPLLSWTMADGRPYTFRLVSITDDQRRRLEPALEHSSLSRWLLHDLRVAVLALTPAAFGLEPHRVLGLEIARFVLSLGYGPVTIPWCFLVENPYDQGYLGSCGFDPYVEQFGGGWPAIAPTDGPAMRFYMEAFRRVADDRALYFAAHRFSMAACCAHGLDALVDLVISMGCGSFQSTVNRSHVASIAGIERALKWPRVAHNRHRRRYVR